MFTPPARKSMSDLDLQNALGAASADESGILAAMELLETQSALRDQDNKDFNDWVEKLTEIGTPEALHAIENGRRLIAGLEPIQFEQPVAAESLPSMPEETVPEETTTADSVPEESAAYKAVDATSLPIESAVEVAPIVFTHENQAAHSVSKFDDDIAASLNALYAAPAASSAPTAEAASAVPEALAPAAPTEFEAPAPHAEIIETVEPEALDLVTALDLPSEEPAISDFEVAMPEAVLSTPVVDVFDEIIAPTQLFEDAPAASVASLSNASAASSVEPSTTASTKQAKAISQLWPWLSIAGGGFAVLVAFAISLLTSSAADGIFAIVVGFAAANVPVVAGAVAGKRSGLPSTFVSRAAFGVFANQAPGWVLQLVRLASLAGTLALVIYVFSLENTVDTVSLSLQPAIVAVAGLCVIVAVVLALNYQIATIARLWISAIGFASVVALAVALASQFSFANLQFSEFHPNIAWGCAAIVFAIFVAVWSPSAADYSRELAKSSKGLVVVAFTLIGSLVAPTLLTIFFYSSFAGAASSFRTSLTSGLANALSTLSPVAYVAFALASSTALIAWLAAGLFSTKLSLAALGVNWPARVALILVAAISCIAAIAILMLISPDQVVSQLASYLAVLAVPVVIWAGIFSADVFLRRVAYHEVSLNRAYGFYKSVNITTLAAWVILTAIGLGLYQDTSAASSAVNYFAGYLVDIAPGFTDAVANSGALLFILFGLGLFVPIVGTIPRIKQQEREALALEARRDDLKDIFKFGE